MSSLEAINRQPICDEGDSFPGSRAQKLISTFGPSTFLDFIHGASCGRQDPDKLSFSPPLPPCLVDMFCLAAIAYLLLYLFVRGLEGCRYDCSGCQLRHAV